MANRKRTGGQLPSWHLHIPFLQFCYFMSDSYNSFIMGWKLLHFIKEGHVDRNQHRNHFFYYIISTLQDRIIAATFFMQKGWQRQFVFNYTTAFSTNPAMTQRDRGTTDEKGVPICVGQPIWRRNG